MVNTSFLSDATATRIKEVRRHRGFLTRLALADPPRSIAFDRDGVAIPAQDVLIVWANREVQADGSTTVNVIATSGELQRWASLDAQTGDQFMLDGQTGEVTEPVRIVDGVALAGFRLVSGR